MGRETVRNTEGGIVELMSSDVPQEQEQAYEKDLHFYNESNLSFSEAGYMKIWPIRKIKAQVGGKYQI